MFEDSRQELLTDEAVGVALARCEEPPEMSERCWKLGMRSRRCFVFDLLIDNTEIKGSSYRRPGTETKLLFDSSLSPDHR